MCYLESIYIVGNGKSVMLVGCGYKDDSCFDHFRPYQHGTASHMLEGNDEF